MIQHSYLILKVFILATSIYSPQALKPEIAQVGQFILPLLNRPESAKLLYHSFTLAEHLAQFCIQNTALLFHAPIDLNVLVLVAYFYPVGFHIQYNNPLPHSLAAFEDFAQLHKLENNIIVLTRSCLQQLADNTIPAQHHALLFKEILWLYPLLNNFKDCILLLRSELELIKKQDIAPDAWRAWQIDYLMAHKIWHHTALQKTYAAKREFILNDLLQEQRLALTQLDKKSNKKAKDLWLDEPERPIYDKLEQSLLPNKGLQTFWRTVYPMHIQLNSIADNKANMMISINSILLTLILASFSIGLTNVNEIKAGSFLLPMLFLIFTALSSLLIAVLSVLPKLLHKNNAQKEEKTLQKLFFFGNFVQHSEEEYIKEMHKLFENNTIFYNSLNTHLFTLGKELATKYRLLCISYGIFFIGLIISAIAFLITLFI